MEKWKGKVAIVTGASSGIGKSIAITLAKNGINVIGLARREDKIEEYVQEMVGDSFGKIYAKKCDMSDIQAIKDTVKWIEENFGLVHILINNAGTLRKGGILSENQEMDEKLAEIISVNFTGVVYMTRNVFRLMKKSDDYGMIVNINSVAGHKVAFIPGDSNSNVYNGTKYAITATTEVLRQELVKMENDKIRVTSLSPGTVESDIFHIAKFLPENVRMKDVAPALDPADISNAILYLLSTPYNVNVTELTIRPIGEKF